MRVPSVRVSKKRLGRVLCINHYGHCRGTYTWSHLFVTVFGYRLPSLQRRISKQPDIHSQFPRLQQLEHLAPRSGAEKCPGAQTAAEHASTPRRVIGAFAIADLGAAPSKCQIDTNILRILYISCLFRPIHATTSYFQSFPRCLVIRTSQSLCFDHAEVWMKLPCHFFIRPNLNSVVMIDLDNFTGSLSKLLQLHPRALVQTSRQSYQLWLTFGPKAPSQRRTDRDAGAHQGFGGRSMLSPHHPGRALARQHQSQAGEAVSHPFIVFWLGDTWTKLSTCSSQATLRCACSMEVFKPTRHRPNGTSAATTGERLATFSSRIRKQL